MRFRVDGVLLDAAAIPIETAGNVVARLKVMAGLLTYHTDRPQEGRIVGQVGNLSDPDVEMRVCTYPTLHGERAVVRLFAAAGRYQHLDDLGLTDDALSPLRKLLGETSGAIIVSGPAGSGKTTTVYACLREIAGGKGDRHLLCRAPSGPFRQKEPVPFSAPLKQSDRGNSGATAGLPGSESPEIPPRTTGQAGSGALVQQGGRCILSIEDPVEVAVDGVAQSQVHQPSGLDLAAGLRFLMRQDPEVIMVGEIRDRVTAEEALRASLTGHLVLTTFHAGSAAETVGRLSDMGIEPYVLRSGVLAILNQRLLRRLCVCAAPSEKPEDRLGMDVSRVMLPRGCPECGQTGYRGRFLLAEMLTLSRSELARAVLDRCDTPTIERLAFASGMIGRWSRACQAVEQGLTSPAEVRRVLGFLE